MNITHKIEDLRKKKRWSIAKLAREAGIPTVSLRVMINREDVNNYSVPALQKLAKVLDTTVAELTKEDHETDSTPKLSREQQIRLQVLITTTIDEFFEHEKLK